VALANLDPVTAAVNVAEWESTDHFRKAAASSGSEQRISGMKVRAHSALYRIVIE
jgi:hypothetical protein